MTRYTQFRNVLGFERSPRYLAWMKSRFPSKDLHHILGSTVGKKFTDYLVIPVEHSFHLGVVEPNKSKYFNYYLFYSIANLMLYATAQLKIITDGIIDPDVTPEEVKRLIEIISEKENE